MDGALKRAARLVLVVTVVALGGASTGAFAQDDEVYLPEVVVFLHDAGGDAIDYYDTGGTANVIGLMRDISHAFGRVPDEAAIADYREVFDDYRTAGAQFDGKIPRRDGSRLTLRFDTGRLSGVMSSAGFESYLLTICPPAVETELRTSVAEGEDELGCPQWEISVADQPLEIDLRILPDTTEYRRLVIGMVAAALIGVLVAAMLVMVLRRSVLRAFGPIALVVAAIGVAGAIAPSVIAAIVLAALHRPVSSLVLAHDLSVGQQIAATVLPAVLLAVPGTVLAVLALRAPVMTAPVPALVSGPPSPPAAGPGLPTWLDR